MERLIQASGTFPFARALSPLKVVILFKQNLLERQVKIWLKFVATHSNEFDLNTIKVQVYELFGQVLISVLYLSEMLILNCTLPNLLNIIEATLITILIFVLQRTGLGLDLYFSNFLPFMYNYSYSQLFQLFCYFIHYFSFFVMLAANMFLCHF